MEWFKNSPCRSRAQAATGWSRTKHSSMCFAPAEPLNALLKRLQYPLQVPHGAFSLSFDSLAYIGPSFSSILSRGIHFGLWPWGALGVCRGRQRPRQPGILHRASDRRFIKYACRTPSTGPDTHGVTTTPEAETISANAREIAPQMRTSTLSSVNCLARWVVERSAPTSTIRRPPSAPCSTATRTSRLDVSKTGEMRSFHTAMATRIGSPAFMGMQSIRRANPLPPRHSRARERMGRDPMRARVTWTKDQSSARRVDSPQNVCSTRVRHSGAFLRSEQGEIARVRTEQDSPAPVLGISLVVSGKHHACQRRKGRRNRRAKGGCRMVNGSGVKGASRASAWNCTIARGPG